MVGGGVNRAIPRAHEKQRGVHICIVMVESYIIHKLSSRLCKDYCFSNEDKLAQMKGYSIFTENTQK